MNSKEGVRSGALQSNEDRAELKTQGYGISRNTFPAPSLKRSGSIKDKTRAIMEFVKVFTQPNVDILGVYRVFGPWTPSACQARFRLGLHKVRGIQPDYT